ncbi:energy-coupling factor transporter ATPase [Paenibacillus shunpengii]|uniref:Energy-coupling factor transporter ATPase n=1 Tax=Paenibacillus shunpengii TaxID=2054424 RepID=A0ABW5SJ28_9BACL
MVLQTHKDQPADETFKSSAAIEVRDLTLQYEEEAPLVLNRITFDLIPGEMLLLLGPSGSGKSSLALCLNGIYPQEIESLVTGNVRIWGRPMVEQSAALHAQAVGIVFQDVDSQFCMLTVEEEVAFCLENVECPQERIRSRMDEALEMVDLLPYRTAQIHTLSGGMKQRLAIACALALRPGILVLDEPTANLDPVATRNLAQLISSLRKKHGITVLLIEHQLDAWMADIDRIALMDHEGQICRMDEPGMFFSMYHAELERMGIWVPGPVTLQRQLSECVPGSTEFLPLTAEELINYWISRSALEQGQVSHYLRERAEQSLYSRGEEERRAPVLEAHGMTFYRHDRPVIQDVSLRVRAGEFIAITGPNGAGKSTLAGLLSGLLTPKEGRVLAGGEDMSLLPESVIRKRVGLVFQHPEHQFVTDKVSEELAFGLRLQGKSEEEVQLRTAELLAEFRLSHLANYSPYALSQGQKRRLSVAAMLVEEQLVLICDEPTYGQDAYASLRLLEALKARVRQGLTVIMITHDMEWVRAYATRVIVVMDGKIELNDRPSALWHWPEERLAEAKLVLPLEVQLARALDTDTSIRTEKFPNTAEAPVHHSSVNEALTSSDEPLTRTNEANASTLEAGSAVKSAGSASDPAQRGGWNLHHMNPSIKALAVTLGVVLLSFAFDPVTQLSALMVTILLTACFGQVSWRRWVLLFAPFLIMALGYVWTAIVFPRESIVMNDEVWIRIGGFEAGRETVLTALSLGLRTLTFSALSLLFILTTDPVKLMFSLMQQCRLSPKLAYGIMAGYRFLPLFREELATMQQAHRMRGIQREKGIRFILHAFKRYSIPLLASSIRKSERVAVAMVSRGFTGKRHRDFYLKLQVRWQDWTFLCVLLAAISICFILADQLGYLEWYGGQL